MRFVYNSHFKSQIKGFIEQKQAIGYPYISGARTLEHFDKYCIAQFPNENVLTREIALGWASLREDEHPNTLMRRITPVRQLGKYIKSIGCEAYIIPPYIPKRQIKYIPHIYTAKELSSFFEAVDACPSSIFSPTRTLVMPVFFRLLYCCGLRKSEARLLCVSDVNLTEGTIFIRESKGHKDRLIYISDDLIRLCNIYNQKMHKLLPFREAFFPNHNGKIFSTSVADKWFHLIWDSLEESKSYAGNSPRIQDFRHTFAVKRLNLWVAEGKDINASLPYLSNYLGHTEFASTDYYLHLVPEFFPLFREKTAQVSANVLPEVDYE